MMTVAADLDHFVVTDEMAEIALSMKKRVPMTAKQIAK